MTIQGASPFVQAGSRTVGHASRDGEAGFSLLEVMVTAVVTLTVLSGAFQAFDDARRAADATAMIADGNQNLRAAIAQITRDALQTGREIPTGGIPVPFGTNAVAIRRPGPPGTALTFPADWEVLPAICPGANLGPALNGVPTDIVTVLYGDPTLPLNAWPLASVAADGSRATVDNRTPIGDARTGVRPGDLIWFTNGLGNAIQTVTSVEGQSIVFAADGQADAFGFNQRGAEQGTILQIRGGATFPPTSATRVVMVSYYLDTVTTPGVPRLVRRVNFGPERPLAVGIDAVQVSYDLVDGATNPTNVEDVLAPNSPMQVRKLNLFVSAVTRDRFSQSRQPVRSSVGTQISLRSMSFVDRYR